MLSTQGHYTCLFDPIIQLLFDVQSSVTCFCSPVCGPRLAGCWKTVIYVHVEVMALDTTKVYQTLSVHPKSKSQRMCVCWHTLSLHCIPWPRLREVRRDTLPQNCYIWSFFLGINEVTGHVQRWALHSYSWGWSASVEAEVQSIIVLFVCLFVRKCMYLCVKGHSCTLYSQRGRNVMPLYSCITRGLRQGLKEGNTAPFLCFYFYDKTWQLVLAAFCWDLSPRCI